MDSDLSLHAHPHPELLNYRRRAASIPGGVAARIDVEGQEGGGGGAVGEGSRSSHPRCHRRGRRLPLPLRYSALSQLVVK